MCGDGLVEAGEVFGNLDRSHHSKNRRYCSCVAGKRAATPEVVLTCSRLLMPASATVMPGVERVN